MHINLANTELQEEHAASFVSIVTESRYAQPTANISEKVVTPALFCTPFILVAPPGSLKYLKEEYGLETFDKWWDESYDQIENHTDRLNAILALMDKIQQMPLSQLTEMHNDMMPLLRRNHEKVWLKTVVEKDPKYNNFNQWITSDFS